MKNRKLTILSACLMAALMITSCDKNKIVPDYQTIGQATSTTATLSVSDDEPSVADVITLDIAVFSLAADPLKSVVLSVKVGDGDYVVLNTFDESSTPQNSEANHVVEYIVPANAGGEEIVFDMVVTSQKQFPLYRSYAIEVQ